MFTPESMATTDSYIYIYAGNINYQSFYIIKVNAITVHDDNTNDQYA